MNNIHREELQLEPLVSVDSGNQSLKTIRDVDKVEKKLGRSQETLIARGAIYFNKRDYDKAKYYFLLSANKGYSTTLITCLLKVHSKLKTMEEAEQYFLAAKNKLSENPIFWQLWGYVHLELKNFSEASEKFFNAKKYNFPDKKLNTELLLKTLNNSDQDDKVIEIAEEAINDGYREISIIECYVAALVSKGEFETAYHFLNDIENEWSESARTHAFFALCVNVLFQDNEKAYSYNKRACELDPNNIQIRWNLALTQLRSGKLKEGIENYKIRFEWEKFPSPRRVFEVPKWNEEVDKNSKILVWTEQGLGDDLLFCTAIEDFKKEFPNLIFEHHNKTGDLMKASFPDLECREAIFKLDLSPIYFDYDFHVPLGDLYLRMLSRNVDMLYNGNNLTNKHYLKAEPLRAIYWKNKLPDNGKPKVGFAWTSKKLDEGREKHHTKIKDWTQMLSRGDVDFVSLQYNFDFQDLKNMEEDYSKYFFDTGYLDQLDDIEGAVALISNLDLVITSGSAPFILGGALGKETWVYGQYGPFSLGRKGKFFSNPVLPNIKHYTTAASAFDETLIPAFSERLDNFVSDFYKK
jgi:predicted Zn-dependent protease